MQGEKAFHRLITNESDISRRFGANRFSIQFVKHLSSASYLFERIDTLYPIRQEY